MGQSSGTTRPEIGLLIAGRYELQSELGRGGMGSVWLAIDRAERRNVAIKFQGPAQDGANDRRFAREADALCRLTCPHVVRFYYAGRERGLSFIVMEHLLGHTLRRRLEVCGQLHAPEVSSLIWQAAIGLGSAHRGGIVHRDVKPSNLFMTVEAGKDCLKVIDFGIAKGRGLGNSTSGTGPLGSPGYMSPEQVLGDRVDHRSDVWSLAVVAFTALCGKEPFTAENVPATMDRIARGQARQITSERPELPAALDAFFARAFVRDPEHRFQSPAEVAVHFERACQGVALESLGRLSKTKSLAPSVPAHRLAGGHSPPASSQPPSSANPGSGLPAAPSHPPGRTQRSHSPLPGTAASYSSPPAHAPSYPPAAPSYRPAAPSYPPRDSAPTFDRSSSPDDSPVAIPMTGPRLSWVLLGAAGLVTLCALLFALISWSSSAPAPPEAPLREPSALEAPSAPPALETAARIPTLASAPPAPDPVLPAEPAKPLPAEPVLAKPVPPADPVPPVRTAQPASPPRAAAVPAAPKPSTEPVQAPPTGDPQPPAQRNFDDVVPSGQGDN